MMVRCWNVHHTNPCVEAFHECPDALVVAVQPARLHGKQKLSRDKTFGPTGPARIEHLQVILLPMARN